MVATTALSTSDIQAGSVLHGRIDFSRLSTDQISEVAVRLEDDALRLAESRSAALEGTLELYFACKVELALRSQQLPEPPSAVCWEHVDGQDPVRLSFSILVF